MSHLVIDARELRTSTGRYIERLLHYLQEIDTQNSYTILLNPKDIEGWAPTNPNFTALACPHKEFTFDEQVGLLKQINNLKPDLTHFGMVQQPILYRGTTVTTMHDLTTVRFKNPSKNPVIFTLKQQVYKYLNKRVARKSQAIITPTEFVKNDVAAFTNITPDKITVTLESADKITSAAEPIQKLTNKQFIMYVGRPTPHKNLERLIGAFALLKKTHPNLVLVLAGKRDVLYEAHQKRATELGINDIHFTGFVSEGALRWLYENCATYAFPSLSEGFGLPGVEAMLHGAPVVSSNSTCLPEVLGSAAHYFDPLSIEDMAAKINDVLTDEELRNNLITAGHRQANKYSWKRMAEQTLEVYNKALRKTI